MELVSWRPTVASRRPRTWLPRSERTARAEGFNITNTPQFGNPGTGFGTGGFGFITSTRTNTFRQFQLAAKFYF